jgi:hypothetical protein
MKLKLPPHLAELNPHLVAGTGKAAPLKVGDGYRSDLERRAAREWVPGQQPATWLYEPLTFHLVGYKYTPDFLLVAESGNVSIVEVKGWNKNLRADRMKFNAAAETHRWARWCWLTWHPESGWNEDWHD